MAAQVTLSIGGEARKTARSFDRLDPVTGAVATSAAAANAKEASAAADAAAKAFPAWSQQGPNARRAQLMKAADALEAKADQFVDAMMGETGATEGWARFNLMLAAGMIREAAALTTQIGGEVIPSVKPG
jgi:acyl-CoA reductase-like NAD-dependent aldehyde dehydrogenase